MHPTFVRLGVFLLFLRKKGGKCTQILYLWVLFKQNNLKKLFPDPNFQKYLEGNTTVFFFGLIKGMLQNMKINGNEYFASPVFKDYRAHYFPRLNFPNFWPIDAKQSKLQNFFKKYGAVPAI